MWELMTSRADWDAYRARCEQNWDAPLGSIQFSDIDLGVFPFLVASLRTASDRAISAVVRPADAVRLLQAAGKLPEGAAAPRPVETVHNLTGATTREHCISVAAHLMTIQNLMIRTGICKPELYTRTYQEALSIVDQWQAEDWEQQRAGAAADELDARKASRD